MANLQDVTFRRTIYERDGGLCGFCGQAVPFERMHLDHAVPRSLGGPDHALNLRPAHRSCNQAAGNRKPRQGQLPLTVAGDLRLTVRMPESLRNWLRATGRAERRSINDQVLYLLEAAKRRQEESPPRP